VLGPFHFELRAILLQVGFQQATKHTEHSSIPGASSTCTRHPPAPGTPTLTCRACPGGDWGAACAKNHNQTTQRPSSTHLPTCDKSNPAAAQRQPSGRRTTARPPLCRTHTSQLHQRRRAASQPPRVCTQPANRSPAPSPMYLHPSPQTCSITRMADVPAGEAAPTALWRAAGRLPGGRATAHACPYLSAVPARSRLRTNARMAPLRPGVRPRLRCRLRRRRRGRRAGQG